VVALEDGNATFFVKRYFLKKRVYFYKSMDKMVRTECRVENCFFFTRSFTFATNKNKVRI